MSQERSVDPDPLEDVPVVNSENLEATWREAPREWGHSMHKLAPYVGGYPPSLAYYFISRYTTKNDRVFDPFCGGGTTPLEALNRGREAVANDPFTYAYTLTHAKCKPLEQTEFDAYLDKIFNQIESLDIKDLAKPDSDIEIFFHEDTLEELLKLRHLLNSDNSREALFLKALICGILHGPSQGFLSIQTKDTFSGSPDYVRRYIDDNELVPEYRNVREKVEDKYEAIMNDGIIEGPSEILKQDARTVEPDSGVDFILTSPPYMHVLDYTWNNWLRLWWLDEEKDDERDDLVLTADTEKYTKFIRNSLSNMYNVLSNDSRAVIVIGGVRKHRASGTKKVRVPKLIAKQAAKVGFDIEKVIDDAYGLEKRSYTKFNEIRYETEDEEEDDQEELIDRCLVLTKGTPTVDNDVSPAWSTN